MTRSEQLPGSGFVQPSFAAGSILLKNAEGGFLRLSWGEGGEVLAQVDDQVDDQEDDLKRAVAPGRYTLAGYRILKHDDEGTRWFISALSPRGTRIVNVEKGKTTDIRVDETIFMQAKGRINKADRLAIQMQVLGGNHSGLSIYRDGVRIPIDYQIAVDDREILETGPMEYG